MVTKDKKLLTTFFCRLSVALICVLALGSQNAAATIELRFLEGLNSFDSGQVDTELKSLNVPEIKGLTGWGIDLSQSLGYGVYIGLRGMFRRTNKQDPNGATSPLGGSTYSQLSMESAGPILRFFLFEGSHFRFDVFGGPTFIHAGLEASTANGVYTWNTTRDDIRYGSVGGISLHFCGGYDAAIALEMGFEKFHLTDLNISPNAPTGALDSLNLSGMFLNLALAIRLHGKPQPGENAPAASSASSQCLRLFPLR